VEKIEYNFSWIDEAKITTREVIVYDDNGNSMCFDEDDLIVLLSSLVRRKRDLK
jgi:hypothetical protein